MTTKGLVVVLGTLLCSPSLYAQEAGPPAADGANLAGPASGGDDRAGVSSLPVSRPDGETMARTAQNSIWAEGLGAGLLYSINYERMMIDDLGVRVGIAYYSFGASVSNGQDSASSKASFFVFPITASYLGISSSNKKHCFEIGGGATIVYATAAASGGGISAEGSGMGGFGQVLAGYRIQPADGGFQFRVGVMALFGPGLGFSVSDPTAWGALPWGYISFGGTF